MATVQCQCSLQKTVAIWDTTYGGDNGNHTGQTYTGNVGAIDAHAHQAEEAVLYDLQDLLQFPQLLAARISP